MDEEMTKEEMKEIVSKLDEDQKKTLRHWAEGADKDPKELIRDFCTQYKRDVVKDVPEEDRVQWAMGVVDSHIANEMAQPTEWIEIYTTGVNAMHGVENSPGNVHGIGAVPGVNEAKEVIINAWRENKKFIDELSPGKAYKIKASRQSKITERVTYNFEPQSQIEPSDYLEDASNDEIERVISMFYERTLIKDAERNVSKRNDYTDFRMVKGMVQRHMIKSKDDGSTTCMVFLRDGSIPHKEVEPNSAMTVFVPEEMMKYGTDSELIIIGTIRHDPKSEYGPSMNATGIIPLIPTPLEEDPTSVDEETIEVADAEDVVVEDEDISDEYNDLL
ncbi:hypothetical protein AKJ51_04020 [candidate division MSBL1 archaeon SCGC-AAA382A20]|uniref:Uncharacterized protein n=1 Tax=candidate division MSBL1 archaeon SCGC-AAA382A20 TaxID=1698280 RepID=A0A133VIC7_9EURY|nr:hypothetical protein AKJ51_04020 [candidate division MSBL1 archaeon SCGC-AAA382A20]